MRRTPRTTLRTLAMDAIGLVDRIDTTIEDAPAGVLGLVSDLEAVLTAIEGRAGEDDEDVRATLAALRSDIVALRMALDHAMEERPRRYAGPVSDILDFTYRRTAMLYRYLTGSRLNSCMLFNGRS